MTITNDIKYVGVNDHKIDLFEGQFDVPLGMAYNSYVILDDKIAVLDSVDKNFKGEWLNNISAVLGKKQPDYLIVHHMEGDHSANISAFMEKYPKATVVGSSGAFNMMKNYFGTSYDDRRIVVKTGDVLHLGKHNLTFVSTPMVHWPEVIMSYDSTDKVLFSADAFGKFGANDTEDPEGWDCEARRYYFGIVGKYGVQVQKALNDLKPFDIKTICSLHGPVLTGDLSHYLEQYNTWSSYGVETEGVFIAYSSVYGHTKQAALFLEEELKKLGCPKVSIADLAREDMYECVEDAFRYGKLVIATTTYNGDIFPVAKHFVERLLARGYQKRNIGIIENGSWAPQVVNVIKKMFDNSKEINFYSTCVKIVGAMNQTNKDELNSLAKELIAK